MTIEDEMLTASVGLQSMRPVGSAMERIVIKQHKISDTTIFYSGDIPCITMNYDLGYCRWCSEVT